MRRGLFVLMMLIGCGGDVVDQDICRGGGGDLSSRDVCRCIRAAGCARTIQLGCTKYTDQESCEGDATVRAACDRQSDAKVYGPGVIAPCMGILDSATCAEYAPPSVVVERVTSCLGG